MKSWESKNFDGRKDGLKDRLEFWTGGKICKSQQESKKKINTISANTYMVCVGLKANRTSNLYPCFEMLIERLAWAKKYHYCKAKTRAELGTSTCKFERRLMWCRALIGKKGKKEKQSGHMGIWIEDDGVWVRRT